MSIILDGTNGITSAGSVNVDELKDKDSTGAPDFPNGISAEYVIVDSGSADSPSITFDGDTNTGIFRPGANTVAWSTNGSERMRITSTGNITANNIYTLSADVASPVFNVDYDAFTLPAPTNNRVQMWIVTAATNNNVGSTRSFGYIIQNHSGGSFGAHMIILNSSGIALSLSATNISTPVVRVKDTVSGLSRNIRVSAVCITPRG